MFLKYISMARLLQEGIGPEWPMKREQNTC